MKYLVLFSILVIIAAALCGVIPTAADMNIYGGVVRLHVLANSDGEGDQAVKLAVRDAVLGYVSCLVTSSGSADEAAETLSENIGDIRAVVEKTLGDTGYDASCSVSLSNEYYPEKKYDDVTFPSGNYTSLKIKLGEGAGHNWWCVLYPTICTSGAKASDVMKQTGFSSDQIRILTDGDTPTYKLKFKILELFSGTSS